MTGGRVGRPVRRVEFSAGSGRIASYTDGETKALQSLIASAETAGDPVRPQVEVLHDLKVEFGANLEALVELGEPQDGDMVVSL